MKRFFTVPVASTALILMGICACTDRSMTIGFTGDVLLDRGVKKQIEREGIESFFTETGKGIPTLDFLVANLECAVTDIKNPINKKFVFRGNPVYLPWLKKLGITHMNCANNHSYDQGRPGLRDMVKLFEKFNLYEIGYGENSSTACLPELIEKNGQKALVFGSVFLKLENWMPLDDSCNICQWDYARLGEAVSEAKTEYPGAIIIVCCHWGTEHVTEPSPHQKIQARYLIDKGADAIIGHHPHVLQKTEIYKNKPIFYSLGNFIFDQKSQENSKSRLVEIIIDNGDVSWQEHSYKIVDCKPVVEEYQAF